MCRLSVQVTSSWTSNKLFHSNPSKAELFAILPNSLLNCEHPPTHSVAQAKNKGKHYLQLPFPICHVWFVKHFWQLFHWDLCTLGFLFACSDCWPLLSCLDAENSLSAGGQTFLLVSWSSICSPANQTDARQQDFQTGRQAAVTVKEARDFWTIPSLITLFLIPESFCLSSAFKSTSTLLLFNTRRLFKFSSHLNNVFYD